MYRGLNIEVQPFQGNTMKNDTAIDKEQPAHTRFLLKQQEAGERKNAVEVHDKVASRDKHTMFYNIVMLTRELQKASSTIKSNRLVNGVTKNGKLVTEDRLDNLVQLAAQASNRVLTVVEESIALCSESNKKNYSVENSLAEQDHKEHSQQTIPNVISLVNEIEKKIIKIIRITNCQSELGSLITDQGKTRQDYLQISDKDSTDVVSCQEDLHKLQSSL